MDRVERKKGYKTRWYNASKQLPFKQAKQLEIHFHNILPPFVVQLVQILLQHVLPPDYSFAVHTILKGWASYYIRSAIGIRVVRDDDEGSL